MATVNLAIGQVTPPVGVNLFVAIGIKIKKGLEVTLQQISKAVMPMLAACVAVLLVVTYVPAVSVALPQEIRKQETAVLPQHQQQEMRIILLMRSGITVILDGKKLPGTLLAPQQKHLPGQTVAVSLAN